MAIFSNQATLTFKGTQTSSNIAYGEILEVLAATKTAIGDSYTQGQLVTYAITLRNTGTATQSGITITDDLGAYAFGTSTLYPLTYEDGSAALFIDGAPTTAPTVTAGPPLVFGGISLPGGSDAVLIYKAMANEYADPSAEGVITNTVSVTATGLSSPVTASEEITSAVSPTLSISKCISPTQVVDNDRVSYTFTIQNLGNQAVVATDDTTITDLFSPILTALSVSYNTTPWTEGVEYTYDETTGTFSTTPGSIVIPAATYTQDPTTGEYSVTPGIGTLVVVGTI